MQIPPLSTLLLTEETLLSLRSLDCEDFLGLVLPAAAAALGVVAQADFLARLSLMADVVGSYLGGRWGEGEAGGRMLRAMEMGVVLWDFFLMGAAAAAASVYDTFFCLSAKTTYRIFSALLHHQTYSRIFVPPCSNKHDEIDLRLNLF